MDKMKKLFKSGVVKQPKDNRDYKFKRRISRAEFPPSYINKDIAEIENQLGTGSCVANATCSSLEMMIRDISNMNLSRMFVYFNAREPYDNLRGVDSGAYVRDGYKSVNTQGVCDEITWPFKESEVNTKPSDVSYEKAIDNKVIEYARVSSNVSDIKAAIIEGNGVIYGTPICDDFYSIRGSLADQTYAGCSGEASGHHAMSVVGYDDALGGFIIENSWGRYWGDGGLFLSKYEDFTRDSYDIWTATLIDFKNIEENEEPDLSLFEKFKRWFSDFIIMIQSYASQAWRWIKGLFS